MVSWNIIQLYSISGEKLWTYGCIYNEIDGNRGDLGYDLYKFFESIQTHKVHKCGDAGNIYVQLIAHLKNVYGNYVSNGGISLIPIENINEHVEDCVFTVRIYENFNTENLITISMNYGEEMTIEDFGAKFYPKNA